MSASPHWAHGNRSERRLRASSEIASIALPPVRPAGMGSNACAPISITSRSLVISCEGSHLAKKAAPARPGSPAPQVKPTLERGRAARPSVQVSGPAPPFGGSPLPGCGNRKRYSQALSLYLSKPGERLTENRGDSRSQARLSRARYDSVNCGSVPIQGGIRNRMHFKFELSRVKTGYLRCTSSRSVTSANSASGSTIRSGHSAYVFRPAICYARAPQHACPECSHDRMVR